MGAMDLRLALLRSTSASQLEISTAGRLGQVRMHVQQKSGLSDRLAVNVLNLIASGAMPSGARLPAERRISASVNASRVSVRNALDRLKVAGFLTAVQGAGTRVSDRHELLAALTEAGRENMAELAEFVSFLDGMLLDRALLLADPLEIGRALAGLIRPPGDAFAEYEFRLRLAELAESPILVRLVGVLKRVLIGYFDRSMLPPRSAGEDRLFAEIEAELMGAVLRSDPARARAQMGRRNLMLREQRLAGAEPGRAGVDEPTILRHLAIEPPEQLRSAVAREIAIMVATGQFDGGRGLFSERRLSDLFGVSRATVQEALTRLKPRGEEAESTPAIRARDLLDLNLIRDHLESWAAAEAATHLDPAGERALRRILTEMRRPIQSELRDMNLDLMLHLTIARISRNALTLHVSEALRTVVVSYFHVARTNPRFSRRPAAYLLAEHEAIVAIIRSRDADAARAAMSRHVAGFRANYQGFVRSWRS